MSGVYAQVDVAKRDAQIISNIVQTTIEGLYSAQSSKFLDPKDYHSTVLYSRVGNIDDIVEKSNVTYLAKIKDIELWTEHDVVLVCALECPALSNRHSELMEKHNLEYDHPTYKPHITLCYEIKLSDKSIARLKHSLVGRTILLNNESIEPLDTSNDDLLE
jgi:2'-5' RNA ligase